MAIHPLRMNYKTSSRSQQWHQQQQHKFDTCRVLLLTATCLLAAILRMPCDGKLTLLPAAAIAVHHHESQAKPPSAQISQQGVACIPYAHTDSSGIARVNMSCHAQLSSNTISTGTSPCQWHPSRPRTHHPRTYGYPCYAPCKCRAAEQQTWTQRGCRCR